MDHSTARNSKPLLSFPSTGGINWSCVRRGIAASTPTTQSSIEVGQGQRVHRMLTLVLSVKRKVEWETGT
jgi:hypothetical protein